jgi:hypothetical protein
MKWALVVVACIALLVVSGVTASQVRWNGQLDQYGNAVGGPVRVGSPFSVGMSKLQAGGRIRIESVRLSRPTRGVVLVGALVHPMGNGMVGIEERFPPTVPSMGIRPANGAVVPPHTPVILVVGMRATRAGAFRVHGVEVLYREHWHGIEVRRRSHVGIEVVGCAARTAVGVHRCTPPEPSD